VKYKDYYQSLGVERDADQDAIKKAYRKLAKKCHPDAHPNDTYLTEKFKEINEAYEVLGNPEKRKKYDALSSQAGGFNGMEFDPTNFGFQQPSGGTRRQYQSAHGFSDFFEAFFGDQSHFNFGNDFENGQFHSFSGAETHFKQPHNRERYAAADVEAELGLTLREAYHGVEKKFSIRIDQQERTLSVKIPPGIMNGEKIKLKGQGGTLKPSSEVKGDLYLHILINDTADLKLDGLDIHMTVPVTPWESALGSEIRVHALAGDVKLKLPPGTSSGKRFRLSKKGFRNRKGETGDLLIEINIDVPTTLSPEERELLEKWKHISTFNPR
jgi:curved DNA-binding protein